MTKNQNPWHEMPESSKRRINADSKHNLYWLTDIEGKFAFYLQSKLLFAKIDIPAKLKGISILKRNSKNNGELFLVLNKKEDWQIFKALCDDLIATTYKYSDDIAMVNAVEVRLRRWQQLLKQERTQEMTLERQMGLFSELSCLKDIITKQIGIAQAVNSWVGANFDKQDFLLDNAIIEVKSHKTSKGAKIKISSLEQLYSEKEPIFLFSYSLTVSDNGVKLDELVNDIKKIINNELFEVVDLFENKLIEYGYIPEIITSNFQAFIIDKIRIFHVKDDFPKITPQNVKSQISFVTYNIDLNHCDEFEIDISKVLKSI